MCSENLLSVSAVAYRLESNSRFDVV